MPIVIETIEEFCARHGAFVEINGYRVFADGATCKVGDVALRKEPPDNLTRLLNQRRCYFAERLRRAEATFRQTQAALAEQAAYAARYTNLPTPPQDAPQHLLRLKQTVEKCRQDLLEINEALTNTPEAQYRRRQEEDRARRAKQCADLHSEISSINI